MERLKFILSIRQADCAHVKKAKAIEAQTQTARDVMREWKEHPDLGK